ncbi:MAG: hypothetical protein QOJ15_10151 [Bradyrhizobium sp.]|nr:hypothetical protein [Bradyrhizobium sp.]
MVQANHTAAAAGCGKIHERLARGLLMWHDRVRDDQLRVTHDFLACSLACSVRASPLPCMSLKEKA